MGKCTDSDRAALNESGRLLRFAAEHVKELDPDLPLAIAEAHVAVANGTWDPKIAQRFWGAFAKLCDLVEPVSMDCLAASEANIEPPHWLKFFGVGKKSIAQRSSTRYLFVLLALLTVTLTLQLYVWTCTNLSKKIDDLFTPEKARFATLASDYAKKITTQTTLQLDVAFAQTTESIHKGLDRIGVDARFLESISTLSFLRNTTRKEAKCPAPGKLPSSVAGYDPLAYCQTPGPLILPYIGFDFVEERLSAAQLAVLNIQQMANLVAGVIGAYILPILFGTIGALAYVVRTISDQIRTTTFAPNSPTRHIMRVALGAMAGVVIGLFGDLSTRLSLSPLAIAFLAGYGVEAVFSMFDGLIEKFKSAKSST